MTKHELAARTPIFMPSARVPIRNILVANRPSRRITTFGHLEYWADANCIVRFAMIPDASGASSRCELKKTIENGEPAADRADLAPPDCLGACRGWMERRKFGYITCGWWENRIKRTQVLVEIFGSARSRGEAVIRNVKQSAEGLRRTPGR